MSAAVASSSPRNHGEAVERWAAEHLGLELEDGSALDARTADGTAIKIKGCRRWVSSGERRRRGRWRVWSDELVHLLEEDGLYLLVLYDPSKSPSEYRFAERFHIKSAEDVGRLAEGRWSSTHRPSKGKQAKIPWREVWPDG